MYDEIVKTFELTSDELQLINTLLEKHQEMCVSTTEIYIVEDILSKLTL